MPLSPGEVIAGYTVVRQLGAGGMGAVYLVRHPRLPRLEAIKLLRPELSRDPTFAARFRREAAAAAQLRHPCVVSVRDVGDEDGQLWLIMDYVDGHDLEEELHAAGGLLSPDRAAHVLAQVAGALDAAHRHKLVHRDVKPANILVAPAAPGESDQVFLTDFGIAKSLDSQTAHTATGAVLATFDYASPEQIESRPLDARSDVYALGCLLVRMLTGEVPFPGDSLTAPIHGHLLAEPPRPSERIPWLPPAIDAVVARAMAKDPVDRYESCRALAEATATALAELPDVPGPPYRISLSRTASDGNTHRTGPLNTDALPAGETRDLVELARRTRFFDLPSDLTGLRVGTEVGPVRAGTGRRRATLEIVAGTTSRRVLVDLDGPRPPAFDDLVAAVEQLGRRRAAETVVPAPAADDPHTPPDGGDQTSAPRRPRGRGRRRALLVVAIVVITAALTAGVVVLPHGWASQTADSPEPPTSSAATATTSSVPTPSWTGPQLAAAAADALDQAGAVRIKGTLTGFGRTQTVDLLLQGAWDANGTLTQDGQTAEVIASATQVYVRAAAAFYPTQGLTAPDLPDLRGTWVRLPRAAADVALPMSLHGLSDALRHPETAAIQDPVTTGTVDGHPVLVVTETDGSTFAVAARGTPYVLRWTSNGTVSGTVTVSHFGETQTVLAPSGFVDYPAGR